MFLPSGHNNNLENAIKLIRDNDKPKSIPVNKYQPKRNPKKKHKAKRKGKGR